MQKQIEPTYLRYIFDGLNNKSIHPQNASSLPDGFVGLYETVFDESVSASERQKNIKLFALWALLKKEVSISFVTQALNEKEENVQEFVLRYSNWFNSPEPGKYLLYHERLRIFVLSKASQEEILEINSKILSTYNKINSDFLRLNDNYIVQFYLHHLLFDELKKKSIKSIIEIIKSSELFQQQFAISNEYKWSIDSVKIAIMGSKMIDSVKIIPLYLYLNDLFNKQKRLLIEIADIIKFNDVELFQKRLEQLNCINLSYQKNRDFVFLIYIYWLFDIIESDVKYEVKINFISQVLISFEVHVQQYNCFSKWNRFFPAYYVFKLHHFLKKMGLNIDFLLLNTDAEIFQDYWLKGKILFNEKEELFYLIDFIKTLSLKNKNQIGNFLEIGLLFIQNNMEAEFYDLYINTLEDVIEKNNFITQLNDAKFYKNFEDNESIESRILVGLDDEDEEGYNFHIMKNQFNSISEKELQTKLKGYYFDHIFNEKIQILDKENNDLNFEYINALNDFDIDLIFNSVKDFCRLVQLRLISVYDEQNDYIIESIINGNYNLSISLIKISSSLYKLQLLGKLFSTMINKYGVESHQFFSTSFNKENSDFLINQFIRLMDFRIVDENLVRNILSIHEINEIEIEYLFWLHKKNLFNNSNNEILHSKDLFSIYPL